MKDAEKLLIELEAAQNKVVRIIDELTKPDTEKPYVLWVDIERVLSDLVAVHHIRRELEAELLKALAHHKEGAGE